MPRAENVSHIRHQASPSSSAVPEKSCSSGECSVNVQRAWSTVHEDARLAVPALHLNLGSSLAKPGGSTRIPPSRRVLWCDAGQVLGCRVALSFVERGSSGPRVTSHHDLPYAPLTASRHAWRTHGRHTF